MVLTGKMRQKRYIEKKKAAGKYDDHKNTGKLPVKANKKEKLPFDAWADTLEGFARFWENLWSSS